MKSITYTDIDLEGQEAGLWEEKGFEMWGRGEGLQGFPHAGLAAGPGSLTCLNHTFLICKMGMTLRLVIFRVVIVAVVAREGAVFLKHTCVEIRTEHASCSEIYFFHLILNLNTINFQCQNSVVVPCKLQTATLLKCWI